MTVPPLVCTDGINDHIGKMMHVHDDVGDPGITQFLYLPLKQRFTCQLSVSGLRRVPKPAAKINPCTIEPFTIYELKITVDASFSMNKTNTDIVFLFQMFRQMLRTIDRTVLSARTTESNLHMFKIAFHEPLYMMVH